MTRKKYAEGCFKLPYLINRPMQLQVFGRPSQIMGGLFKFIDGVTNENCEGGKRGDAALIVAHVNEVRD